MDKQGKKGGGEMWILLLILIGFAGFMYFKPSFLFSSVPLYGVSTDTNLQLLLYGGNLIDNSMYNHPLTGVAPSVAGFFETGYDFTGATNYVNTTITLANNSDMCFMAWVNKKGAGIGQNYGRFFSADNAERVIYSDATNQTHFQFAYGTVFCNGQVHTTNLINVWHHIAAVKYGTNVLLFVDGVLENTCPITELRQIKNIIIGNSNTLTRSPNAYMDEIRVYDRACLYQEIKDAANVSNYVITNTTIPPLTSEPTLPTPFNTGTYVNILDNPNFLTGISSADWGWFTYNTAPPWTAEGALDAGAVYFTSPNPNGTTGIWQGEIRNLTVGDSLLFRVAGRVNSGYVGTGLDMSIHLKYDPSSHNYSVQKYIHGIDQNYKGTAWKFMDIVYTMTQDDINKNYTYALISFGVPRADTGIGYFDNTRFYYKSAAVVCDSDGICDAGETTTTCPSDCHVTAVCDSDGICDTGETVANCYADCYTPTCSDDIKNQDETGIDCGGVCTACQTTNQTSCTTNEDCPADGIDLVCRVADGKCVVATDFTHDITKFITDNLIWVAGGVVVLFILIMVMKK